MTPTKSILCEIKSRWLALDSPPLYVLAWSKNTGIEKSTLNSAWNCSLEAAMSCELWFEPDTAAGAVYHTKLLLLAVIKKLPKSRNQRLLERHMWTTLSGFHRKKCEVEYLKILGYFQNTAINYLGKISSFPRAPSLYPVQLLQPDPSSGVELDSVAAALQRGWETPPETLAHL